MRFHFSRDAVAFVEFHNARVVLEHADAPWRFDLFGGFGDVAFEEALDFYAVKLYFAFESFVAAMLAPTLADGLQFDVSWIAVFCLKIVLNAFEFLDAES